MTFLRKSPSVDLTLLVAVFALAVLGLVVISSVSVYESHQVMLKQGVDCALENCNSFYFWRQLWHLGVAAGVGLVVMNVPYHFWRYLALPAYALSFVLLLLVFVPGLGIELGGARGWLDVGVATFQPAELAKIGLILYFARFFEKRSQDVATFENGFIPFAILLSLFALPLLLQPDLGSLFVVTLISTSVYFAAGASWRHLLGGGLAAFLLGLFVIYVFDMTYVKDRIAVWLDPSLDPEGVGFQMKQSLIAIGKGQLFGTGLGSGVQKFGYLPEVQSDSIFAAMSEEFGFFGTNLLVLLPLFLISARGLKVASDAPDRFGSLLAVGCATWLVGQALVNIGVMTGLLPLTGITFPFISYGGSSLVGTFVAAGILLNVSKHSSRISR